jgi:hypothetical protein
MLPRAKTELPKIVMNKIINMLRITSDLIINVVSRDEGPTTSEYEKVE